MKKSLFLLFISALSFVKAQEKVVDLFSVNVPVIGVGVEYEKALGGNTSLVADAQYLAGFTYQYSDYYGSEFNFALFANFSLEARYYYNFNRRLKNGKNTLNNSANYFALKGQYTPDFLTVSSDDYDVLSQAGFTLNYGLKRNFNDRFFYEFYAGLGVSIYKEEGYTSKTTDGLIDLGFKFGYYIK